MNSEHREVVNTQLSGNLDTAVCGAATLIVGQADGFIDRGDSLATLDGVISAKGAQAVAANRPSVPVTVVPVPTGPGMTPASWSRDPSALNLRKAVAGADGGTVPGLDDSNFETPEVTGHSIRRRPLPLQVALPATRRCAGTAAKSAYR